MKITAGLSRDRRIAVRFDVRNPKDVEEASALAHRVPGGRYRKIWRMWVYPLSLDTCHAMRREWGQKLRIRAELSDWYRGEVSTREQQTKLASATTAELIRLPTVAPRLHATLRPDQRVGAAWLARGYRNAGLVADSPGLGKTLETIGGLLEADVQGSILVVCPRLSVKSVWFREWSKWTDESVHFARGTREQRERALWNFFDDPSKRKILIIVAEMLRVKRRPPREGEPKSAKKRRGRVAGYEYPQLFDKRLLDGGWSAVVVDESHRLFGSLTIAKSNLMGEGLASLPLRQDARRIPVTGTPFGRGGRVYGMFGTLHWCWPDEFTSFWRWAGQHFEIEEEIIGRGGKTAKKIGDLREGTGEDLLDDLGPRVLRRRKEEVLPNLPPKQYVEVPCEMDPAQAKQYEKMQLDGEIKLVNGVLSVLGVLAAVTRAKQLANGEIDLGEDGRVTFTGRSCKLEALLEKLDQRGILSGEGDGKVIIGSQYNEFLKVVCDRLDKEGVEYHLLTGSTSDKKRESAMEEFQGSGGPQVFIMNTKAGGVSITLDAADDVHALDELWNPEDNEQFEDRVHRASRIHQVTIYYYRTEGTIDQAIAEDVEEKRTQQFHVMDGRRGLEYVRQLIRHRKD